MAYRAGMSKSDNNEKTKDKTYDVLIVGGGLSGLSLCCLLGKIDGLKVACIDQDTPKEALTKDERTTAISYGSSKILDRAGVWQDMVKEGCPIEDIEILDGQSSVLLQFLSAEVDGKPFGWIIPNKHIRQSLYDRIGTLKSIDLIAPAQVKDFEITSDVAALGLENGEKLTAKLIIGADGRKSAVRDFMDVDVRSWAYNQRAIVCFVTHEHPHNNVGVEHFYPDGPVAILPMNDLKQKGKAAKHQSSLVFTEHGRTRKSLMDLTDQEFAEKVQARFPERYGRIEIVDNKRLGYPLSLSHAASYIAPRMALVADAAHGIHPIAGQGLNLGFRDLNTLSHLIKQAHEKGTDIGDMALLQTYQTKRRPDNMAMVAVTDGLVRLFSNDLLPVRAFRRAGLKIVGRLPMAKKFLMRRAMGE